MPQSSSNTIYAIVNAALLAIILLVAYYLLSDQFDSGTGMPKYSVFSKESDGLAAASTVLTKLGYQPVPLTRPLLSTNASGLLFVIEPTIDSPILGPVVHLGELDTKALLQWVAEGNTLVLCTDSQTDLHDEINVTVDKAPKNKQKLFSVPTMPLPGYTVPGSDTDIYTVRTIALSTSSYLVSSSGVPLWNVKNGIGALLLNYKSGRIILISDPNVFTHRNLAQADNVLFLANLATMDSINSRVYFDEFHHGIRSSGSYMDYIRRRKLHWIGYQLLCVVGLWLWMSSFRLGNAIRKEKPVQEDAVEYATAAARIYERAGIRSKLAEGMARDFLDRLTKHLRLRRNVGEQEILSAMQRRHGPEMTQELAPLLKKVLSFLNPKTAASLPTRRGLLLTLQQLDSLIARCEDH